MTIIYDESGIIIHTLEGYKQLNIMEIDQFQENELITKIDVTAIPHKIVTEKIEVKPTYEELETRLLQVEGVI